MYFLCTQILLWKNNMHVKSHHFLSMFIIWLLFLSWVIRGELIIFCPITGHVFLLLLGAYLQCDKDGNSRVCNRAHILLILHQYMSCIIPLFLFWKFLYSYVSDANRCLMPCHWFLPLRWENHKLFDYLFWDLPEKSTFIVLMHSACNRPLYARFHSDGGQDSAGWHPLRWRHNGRDSVSNHQPHHCLPNRLFNKKIQKTWKLRVTGLCAGNSPGTAEFPAQMTSNAENVSIWWRHHANGVSVAPTLARLRQLVKAKVEKMFWKTFETWRYLLNMHYVSSNRAYLPLYMCSPVGGIKCEINKSVNRVYRIWSVSCFPHHHMRAINQWTEWFCNGLLTCWRAIHCRRSPVYMCRPLKVI